MKSPQLVHLYFDDHQLIFAIVLYSVGIKLIMMDLVQSVMKLFFIRITFEVIDR